MRGLFACWNEYHRSHSSLATHPGVCALLPTTEIVVCDDKLINTDNDGSVEANQIR
jgi:hypothetical protein